MIRFMRKLDARNTLRYIQCTSNRLMCSKSDDSSIRIDPLEEKSEKSAKKKSSLASAGSESEFYSKALYSENHPSLIDILNDFPADSNSVSLDEMLEFYERISGKLSFTYDAKNHPKFSVLRKATIEYLPQLDTRQVKSVFVAIVSSKPIMNDILGEKIAEALLNRVSFLPFDQILFVDFVLRKCYKKSELSDEYKNLLLALQPLFLAKVDDELDGSSSFEETMKILAYVENNVEILNTKIANSLTTSLLLADDDQFKTNDLISVLIFLANFSKLDEHAERLLRKVSDLWQKKPVTPKDHCILFKVLCSKCAILDKKILHEVYHYAVESVKQQNEKKYVASLLNSFSKMNLINYNLIDHFAKFFETPEQLRELVVQDYIILITACGKWDYMPPNWESHILKALKTFKFSIYLTGLGGFDWYQFVIHLNKLGYVDIILVKNCLRSKYLMEQKYYDPAKVKLLQKMLKTEAEHERFVQYKKQYTSDSDSESSSSSSSDTDDELPLDQDLTEMFGNSKIYKNYQIDDKVTVPFLMKMDLETGDFLSIPTVPSLQKNPKNHLLIGIIVVPETGDNQWSDQNLVAFAKKHCRRLERRQIATIIIEESKWKTLKAYEKSLLFYTKLVTTIENYRKKKLNKLGY